MNSKRLFIILIGLITLMSAGLIAGAYGVNTLMSSQSNKLISLRAKYQALSQEQISLINAKKEIQKYSSLEQITQAVVPQDKDQAEAVREIVNIAANNGIGLGAITFPDSTLGNSTSGATSSSTTSPTVNAQAANVNSPANALSQLIPVKTIAGVYELSITVQSNSSSSVPYDQFINFLTDLEYNRRTSQVSSITLTPDPKNPNNLTFSLTIEDYIKP
jgi:Na+-translocating ferredoxin:NAD+ oxidoreductase RnfG subunit